MESGSETSRSNITSISRWKLRRSLEQARIQYAQSQYIYGQKMSRGNESLLAASFVSRCVTVSSALAIAPRASFRSFSRRSRPVIFVIRPQREANPFDISTARHRRSKCLLHIQIQSISFLKQHVKSTLIRRVFLSAFSHTKIHFDFSQILQY